MDIRAEKTHKKRRIEEEAKWLDNQETGVTRIEVTETWLRRFVVSLALDCHGSVEGIERTCSEVIGVHLSIGKISRIINEAAEKAQEFDEQISLNNIRQGANDEIFQGSAPVLTGIDLESSYVYLLEPADDRSGETWELAMEEPGCKRVFQKCSRRLPCSRMSFTPFDR